MHSYSKTVGVYHAAAFSSSCTGCNTFCLFVSTKQPFISISSTMKCACTCQCPILPHLATGQAGLVKQRLVVIAMPIRSFDSGLLLQCLPDAI